MNFRHLALLALLAAIATTTPACISDPTDADADAGAAVAEGDFTLTFVSGHLGNYWDCPGEANDAGSSGTDPSGAAAPDEAAGDAAAGACAPGLEDSCNGPLNCETAMVVLEVNNTGDTDLGGLSIVSIELIGPDGTSETLEGLGVFATSEPAPGSLTPGASRQVRVEFRGPGRDAAGISSGDAPERHLHIVLSGGDAGEAEITTPSVDSLPAVAT